jgi:hypothetical protein
MFLPYDASLSFWLCQSTMYSWEPLAPPPPPEPVVDALALLPLAGEGSADSEATACRAPAGLPAMRLVFKGVKWTACPVFGLRENAAWDQVSQTHREADEAQRDDNRREARKPRAALPPAWAPKGEE